MRTAKDLEKYNKLRYQAKTEHLLQKETWGMLALCSSTMAVIAQADTLDEARKQALDCMARLSELAYALDSKQSKAFAEDNALYLSKVK